jgi:site-specific DNA-methyltransferase (adenine-specific)
MTKLVAYDAMVRAIAKAEKVDEVKDIRDKAQALEAYARQARDNEALNRAVRIRIRAERAGQLLAQMKGRDELAKQGGDRKSNLTDSSLIVLDDLGISYYQASRWQKLAEGYTDSEFIALLESLPDISTRALLRGIEKETRAKEKMDDTAKWQAKISAKRRRAIEAVCDLRACSCAELLASGIRPDAVITDPPYPAKFLPVFTELAKGCKAARVVMQRIGEHLKYRWTLAYLTPGGQAAQNWKAKAITTWKPVLLFGEAVEWFGDVAQSDVNDNDKRFHHWGQSESGMADLVERLTKPGQLVCDPFLGGGTTAVVSLDLGRRFIGCDIEPDHINKAWHRVTL